MFKFRRLPTKRCGESRQLADRGHEKPYKLEGNSNITSNRVTIPPGFLCLGVKSKTISRNPNNCKKDPCSDKDYILTENLHGLFNNNVEDSFKQLRRSSRISKKPEDTEVNNNNLPSFEYYTESVKSKKNSPQLKDKHKKSGFRNKSIVRNNSKSIFREINERCARARSKKSNNSFNYPITPVINPDSIVEYFHPVSFCSNLSKDIAVDLSQNNYIKRSKEAITEKIRDINQRLCGKMNPNNTPPKHNEKNVINDGMGQQEPFQPIPKCDWIYQTPPRQRVVLAKVEECAIQPAVIYTTKKQSNIYELNPGVTVDLTKYTNGQNVEVDGRYLRHLASFGVSSADMDLTFRVEDAGGLDQVDLADDGDFRFESKRSRKECPVRESTPDLSRLFRQITARPTKTVKKMSRVQNFFGCRSEEDVELTPSGVNLFNSIDEFERDMMFVDDDEDGYKIVNSAAAGEKFNFNVRKNLFHPDDGKMFDFGGQESKMFDFTRLGDD